LLLVVPDTHLLDELFIVSKSVNALHYWAMTESCKALSRDNDIIKALDAHGGNDGFAGRMT
jgi:hypothetical protein